MSNTANNLQNVGAGLAPARPHTVTAHMLNAPARPQTANAYMPSAPARPLTPRALVLRAPGINCDRETAQACRQVGFETDLLHINQLLKTPERLLDYHFLVIPGGFSYGDDLGAGTLLAKNLVIHLGKQLQQFIDEGRLILGICNGFQTLVRAGLLPAMKNWSFDASHIPVTSLTDNASAQFECRWIMLSALPGPCIFTKGIDQH